MRHHYLIIFILLLLLFIIRQCGADNFSRIATLDVAISVAEQTKCTISVLEVYHLILVEPISRLIFQAQAKQVVVPYTVTCELVPNMQVKFFDGFFLANFNTTLSNTNMTCVVQYETNQMMAFHSDKENVMDIKYVNKWNGTRIRHATWKMQFAREDEMDSFTTTCGNGTTFNGTLSATFHNVSVLECRTSYGNRFRTCPAFYLAPQWVAIIAVVSLAIAALGAIALVAVLVGLSLFGGACVIPMVNRILSTCCPTQEQGDGATRSTAKSSA